MDIALTGNIHTVELPTFYYGPPTTITIGCIGGLVVSILSSQFMVIFIPFTSFPEKLKLLPPKEAILSEVYQ